MKVIYAALALTISCMLGPGVAAHAQDAEGINVLVPFDFVVSGKTLPAGAYMVGRISDDAFSGIAISTRNHGVIVLPVSVGEARSAEQAKLSFEYVGNAHFLRAVETPAGTYTFALPRALVALGQATDQNATSVAGAD